MSEKRYFEVTITTTKVVVLYVSPDELVSPDEDYEDVAREMAQDSRGHEKNILDFDEEENVESIFELPSELYERQTQNEMAH